MAAGAGTRQALEDQEATVASDKGSVEADQANVDTAAINLGYTDIRSPIDGKTGPILIQPWQRHGRDWNQQQHHAIGDHLPGQPDQGFIFPAAN